MFHPSKTLPPLTVGFDPAEYHSLGSKIERGDSNRIMSRSELRKFGQCPRRWIEGMAEEKTDATSWGSLIDCILLTPDQFEERYAIAPLTYPAEPKRKGDAVEDKPWNWNASYCRLWRATYEACGRTVVKSDDASEAGKAVKRIERDEVLRTFVMDCDTSVFVGVDYHDKETGLVVPIKCLLDLVPSKEGPFKMWLGDLKTCESANPRSWQKHVFSYAYHYQAALYLNAYNAVTGEQRHTFVHAVQESFPPYEPARRMLAEEYLQLGRIEYLHDLRLYCQCLANNEWPGYDEMPNTDSVNGWSIVQPESWMVTAQLP